MARAAKGGRPRLGWWLGLALWAVPAGLSAQTDEWSRFLKDWRKVNRAPLTLLAPKEQLPPDFQVSDEELLRLVAGFDVVIQPLEGAGLTVVGRHQGWKDKANWLLLDPRGEVVEEGTALPTGDFLRATLVARGGTPTWEALETFLRLNPEHGSALQRRLDLALRLARARFAAMARQGLARRPDFTMVGPALEASPPKLLDPERARGWDREVVDTLDRLSRLPDPWRVLRTGLGELLFRFWLDAYGPVTSPELKPPLRRFETSLLEAWRRRPHAPEWSLQPAAGLTDAEGLGTFWVTCRSLLDGPEALADLPTLTPSPGRPWPSKELLHALWSKASLAGQWTACLAILERIQVEPAGALANPLGDAERRDLSATVNLYKALALAQLGRWPDAVAGLLEIRQQMGKGWDGFRKGMKKDYLKLEQDPRREGRTLPPAGFLAVFDQPALDAPPPVPPPQPFRFLVWGQPDWLPRWPALRAAEPLATWGTEELREESPGAEEGLLLQRLELPRQGWAVFQGPSTLVARGEGCPDPLALDLQLRGVAPSRIARLDAFLQHNPDHLDAHRERYELVRKRMPQPALEARLREDAALAQIPLDFGPGAPWLTDAPAWRVRARHVEPELRSALERWPGDAYLWRAWVAWAAFLPKPPSVLGMAQGIPVFGPRAAWAATLPAAVHQAIAAECRQATRFSDMADWFGGAWAELRPGSSNPAEAKRTASSGEQAIFEGYREALVALKRVDELKEMGQRWGDLRAPAKGKPAGENPSP